jgi:Ser/Thr protein kinase RdoA (MazF antagonist)
MVAVMADGDAADLARRGMDAAVTLVCRLGLRAEEPAVLSSRGNLLVRFPASSVVVRVATLTARTRRSPFAWLAREVAVARYVFGRGGPVVSPTRTADPGPHWQGGFAISLWEYVPPRDATPPSPAECGALLARFHESARGCPADLGELSPATEQITDALAVIERDKLVSTAAVAGLRDAHARVLDDIARAEDGPWIVLHGDAHAGNVLGDARGRLTWVDLEETTRGPAAWDLATLTARYDAGDAQAVLRAYAAEAPGAAVPEPEALAPFRRARDLEAAVWLVCMAHVYPERYAGPAREQIALVLSTG